MKKPSLAFCVWSLAFCVLSCRIVFADARQDALRRYQQGLSAERLGRYEQAYTELQLAGVLDPGNAQIALALGVVATRLARYDEAQRALERSIGIIANSTASYYLLALVYEKKAMDDRALDSWHRFLQLSHDDSLKEQAQRHIAYLQSHANN